MSTESLSNVPRMSASTFIEQMTMVYDSVIKRGLDFRSVPSVMLWGPPGIGKSQAVHELAERIGLLSGKQTKVTDVRLLLFNPIDLRGIPTANADKTLAIWLKPQIFQMDDSDDVVNLLLLDEMSAAPQSVQAAAYQITLDRTIGEHRLPNNCIVIAAGNRTTDKSVAYKMPKALANRLLHIELEGSFAAWEGWAVANGINKQVLGFLSYRQNLLMGFDSSSNDLAFPTPRSWEMASNILNNVSDDIDEMYPLIAGLVGTGAAVELRSWSHLYAHLPRIEDIFDGESPEPPSSTDALFALVSSMSAYAREHKDEMPRIANSIRYAQRLPPDFSVTLMRQYMAIEDGYRDRLLEIPEFAHWITTRGALINAAV